MACRKTRPMPGPREDRLGHDAAADDEREGQDERGGHRQQGVASGVTVPDDPVGHALGARGEDVVLAERLEHRAPRQEHRRAEGDQAQGDHRQHRVVGDVGHVDSVAGLDPPVQGKSPPMARMPSTVSGADLGDQVARVSSDQPPPDAVEHGPRRAPRGSSAGRPRSRCTASPATARRSMNRPIGNQPR